MELCDLELEIKNSKTSYELSVSSLLDLNPSLGYQLLTNPLQTLETLEKTNFVKLIDLPANLLKEEYPLVKDLNKLILLNGTVIRTGDIKVRESFKVFQCVKCKKNTKVFVKEITFGLFEKPVSCSCGHVKFIQVQESCAEYEDYQEIR